MKIRILIADDEAIVRAALASLLSGEPDFEIVGGQGASNGREAVTLANQHEPDVVLMDIVMPILNGIEASGEISKKEKAPKIIILTRYGDEERVEKAFRAGACAYLLKTEPYKKVAQAIRGVLEGRPFASDSISRNAISLYIDRLRQGQKPTMGSELQFREKQALRLIAMSRSFPQIASELGVSVRSVRNIRRSICRKLGIERDAELTQYAFKIGLIQVEEEQK